MKISRTSWVKSKVVVTGAGGFIGSHLVEALLERGADVRALVHYNSRNNWGNLEYLSQKHLSEVEIVTGDLADPFCMDSLIRGADTVFHLAALIAIPYSYRAPQQFVTTNILGTVNVLEACRKHGISKIVHTSTSEVYGSARYVPIDENHPLQGQSPYSASKIGADMMAESYYRSFDLPVRIVRPFNTFGPRQSARAIIPTIVTQLLAGERKVRLGSLTPTRDLNYVGDTVEGFIRAAECDEAVGEIINIGSGIEISMGELFKEIAGLIGVEAEAVEDIERVRPQKSEVVRLLADGSKARRLLGWSSKLSLKEGLKHTIEWIAHHLHSYKPHIYNL